jgi:hypothetical protein
MFGFLFLSGPGSIYAMKATKATCRSSAIPWDQIIHLEGKLPPRAARALLKLGFSERDHTAMRELAAKARAGTLTAEEDTILDTYECLGCVLDILHSHVRLALKSRETTF